MLVPAIHREVNPSLAVRRASAQRSRYKQLAGRLHNLREKYYDSDLTTMYSCSASVPMCMVHPRFKWLKKLCIDLAILNSTVMSLHYDCVFHLWTIMPLSCIMIT